MMNDLSSYFKQYPMDESPFLNKDLFDEDIMILLMKEPKFDSELEELSDFIPSYDDLYFPYQNQKEPMKPQSCYDIPNFSIGTVYDYMDKPCDIPQMESISPRPMMYQKPLVEELQNCHNICLKLMFDLLEADDQIRSKQIKLLYDCACICDSQAKYIITRSMFSKKHAQMCAEICEVCGKACSIHPDFASQTCSRVCLECAKSCFEYAMK